MPDGSFRAAPVPTSDTEPFWRALAAGGLAVLRCTACARAYVVPRARCTCGGELAWTAATGRGTIYSLTENQRPLTPAYGPAPQVIALVELDEGAFLMAEAAARAAMTIGDRVRIVALRRSSGGVLPGFVTEDGE